MARKRTKPAPASKPPELTRAEAFAARVLRDPDYEDFLGVLEQDIFQQWRALAHDKDAAARPLELLEGVRTFTAKVQELARGTRGET